MKTKESEILLTHLFVTQIKVYIATHTHIHTQDTLIPPLYTPCNTCSMQWIVQVM